MSDTSDALATAVPAGHLSRELRKLGLRISEPAILYHRYRHQAA